MPHLRRCLVSSVEVFFIVKSPMDVVCNERKAFAAGVLDSCSHDLDVNSLKLRRRHEQELRYIVETGKFPTLSRLGILLFKVRRLAEANTQVVEGLNSSIKIITNHSPNIRLELLNARLCVRSSLLWNIPCDMRIGSTKHAALRCAAFRVLHDSIKPFAHRRHHLALETSDRWMPHELLPRPTKLTDKQMLACKIRHLDVKGRPTVELQWATTFNTELSRNYINTEFGGLRRMVFRFGWDAFYMCVWKKNASCTFL